MPPADSQLTPEIDRDEERERIVAAIAKAASERGYARLKIDQVVRYAGVSRAAFDSHFTSKEQGIVAAQDAFLERLWLEVEGACDVDQEWPVNVRLTMDAVLAYIVETSALARVFAVEAGAASMAAHERQFATMESFADLLREGRRHYPQTAEMPPEMERVLVGGIASIVSGRLLAEEPLALAELEPELTEFVLVPYVGASEARRVARA